MLSYFSDPILSAPLLSCMLMCLVAAVIGTFVVLKKESLVGEALSHACYPGVVIALLMQYTIFKDDDSVETFFLPLIGASIACFIGLYTLGFLIKKMRMAQDAALCFVLTAFFGVSLTLISAFQNTYPVLYKQMQSYLFGQAATMRDVHVILYFFLTVAILLSVLFFFRPIRIVLFDPEFAHVIGIKKKHIDILIEIMVIAAVVIGMRSVGVVLLSAMFVFPVAAALQWTKKHLTWVIIIAGAIGVASGFFGVIAAHEMHTFLPKGSGAFPTGPMIVMVAAFFFVISAFFAPERGIFFRMYRRAIFFIKCYEENLLKIIWKIYTVKNEPYVLRTEIDPEHQRRPFFDTFVFFLMQKKGWIISYDRDVYQMTDSGLDYAKKIVRLHRLWELYLVAYCGMAKECVHPSAEEMEHIITPEIEKKLVALLHDPKSDPHDQPIPEL